MRTNVFLPDKIGSGYGKFWNDKSRYRVLKGGKGSKKSATTALNFIYRLMKYPESNLLVVRAVMNTHRDSTFAQLKWAQQRLGVSHLWQNTSSPLEMVYKPTGQKILFRGFDDVLKLASTTVPNGYLNFVWVEEAFELSSEEDFDKLDLSVPRGEVPPHLFKQTTLTFNPWLASHWLKKRFFDNPAHNVSTYSTNYLCNEFLDDTDRLVFERMRDTNYRKYTVAGLGEWGVAEGLVFENWQELEFEFDANGVPIANEERIASPADRNDMVGVKTSKSASNNGGMGVEALDRIVTATRGRAAGCRPYKGYTIGVGTIRFEEVKGGLGVEALDRIALPAARNDIESDNVGWQYKCFFGLDYGYTNDPTAFIAFAANPITKEIFIFDEHYERKMLNSDIANMIKRKGYVKERIRADAAEPKSNEDLRRLGIGRIMPSVKGKDSVINGITQLQEYKIYVHPRCENTLHELGSYCWKKDKDERGLNEPEDRDNHLMDALRYAAYDLRFFHPQEENTRHRLTPTERINRNKGISAEDVCGGWGI